MKLAMALSRNHFLPHSESSVPGVSSTNDGSNDGSSSFSEPAFQSELCSSRNGGSVLNYFSLFNVQGLQQKNRPSTVPFLKDILLDKKQVFIALTET